jgi:hypothetical protein
MAQKTNTNFKFSVRHLAFVNYNCIALLQLSWFYHFELHYYPMRWFSKRIWLAVRGVWDLSRSPRCILTYDDIKPSGGFCNVVQLQIGQCEEAYNG